MVYLVYVYRLYIVGFVWFQSDMFVCDIQPKLPLIYPFNTKYDFKLACSVCFEKTGYGPRAFQYHATMPHWCQRDILLVKDKKDLNYFRIRRRQKQVHHTNKNTVILFESSELCLVTCNKFLVWVRNIETQTCTHKISPR